MRVIPVVDLRSGQAVHARGGDRTSYQPVRSLLGDGADPHGLAVAFRDALGLRDIYVADLDALAGGPPDLAFLRRVSDAGLHVWADAGLRDGAGVAELVGAGVGSLIAATETLGGPARLREIVDAAGPARVVFGLDLRAGRPVLAPGSDWGTDRPDRLLALALAEGVRRVLVVDTARVGGGRWVKVPAAVRDRLGRHSGVEVTVGGGVDGRADLETLAALGVAAVLVGSALHDGRLTRADLHDPRIHSTVAD